MSEMNNFQRAGSVSNSHVGADFELIAQKFFERSGSALVRNHRIEIGTGTRRKERRFDLGSDNPPVLIECKSHRWTSTGNMPSAKLSVWNEAMFYFHLAPRHYRKILFSLKDMRGEESLATYYVRCYGHLIPSDVEIWEYDPSLDSAEQLAL